MRYSVYLGRVVVARTDDRDEAKLAARNIGGHAVDRETGRLFEPILGGWIDPVWARGLR